MEFSCSVHRYTSIERRVYLRWFDFKGISLYRFTVDYELQRAFNSDKRSHLLLLLLVCWVTRLNCLFEALIKRRGKTHQQREQFPIKRFDFQYVPIWNFMDIRAVVFVLLRSILCVPLAKDQRNEHNLERIMKSTTTRQHTDTQRAMWHFDYDSFFLAPRALLASNLVEIFFSIICCFFSFSISNF